MAKKILVIDDEPDLCEIIQIFLEDEHYEVMTAQSGEHALRCVGYMSPDLILLDLNMPDISGLEVLTKIRENDATRHTPVVMLTAEGGSDKIMKAEALGATDYLIKPVQQKDVLETVQKIIGPAE